MAIEIFDVFLVVGPVLVLEEVVLASGVEQDGVVHAAQMFRALLRVVVRGLALPDDLVDEVLLAEELVEHDLHVVAGVPVAVVVEAAGAFEDAGELLAARADRRIARVAAELEAARETSLATRLDLARKVFATTSRYDGLITTELERLSIAAGRLELGEKPLLPQRFHIALQEKASLRYGENPHQAAALYVPAATTPTGLAAAKQLQGKELSYNNYVDLEAARSLAAEFSQPAAVIVKHNNPCGTAERETLLDAYLEKSSRVRPGFRIRRRHGLQPCRRCRHGRGNSQAIRGMHRRSRIRRKSHIDLRRQKESPPARAAARRTRARAPFAAQTHPRGNAGAAAGSGRT